MGIVLTVVLLLIPLIAMQFTNEVNWTLFDFVVAGFILGTGFICELVIRCKNRIILLWSYSGSASPHLD
jgi:hypothetical protein